MLSRLFPLGVKVSFEDRVYKLGETINLAVELSPKRDMEVREGRVDLVCDQEWTEVPAVGTELSDVVDDSWAVRAGDPLGSAQMRGRRSRRPLHFRESYVHSSVAFLENGRLGSGTTRSYNPSLEIEPKRPPHAQEAKLRWRLMTTVDVAGARDIKARRLVKVT